MVYGKGKVFDTQNPSDEVLDRDGFVGTDPIYQNFANETDKPLAGGEPSTTSEKSKGEDEVADPENPPASSQATGGVKTEESTTDTSKSGSKTTQSKTQGKASEKL